jgi:hypothetical protein
VENRPGANLLGQIGGYVSMLIFVVSYLIESSLHVHASIQQ